MKHIDKTVDKAPGFYVKNLKGRQLDRNSILAGSYPTLDGEHLFKRVKHTAGFNLFRHTLIREQGYVCCYCGHSVEEDNITIEHVLPKSVHRELVGEYSNLMISCEGGRDIPKDASGTPLYDRTYFPTHCDASKGHEEIPIKPSDDCEGRFFYDEFGGISYATGDADAQDTISKLRLDSPYLTQERSDEILHTLYDETGTMLTPAELELMYDRMMTKDKDGRYHNFHFVIASVIMGLL